MTQAELARAAGTRERNIIRWENEQHAPRLENIIRIAAATGKPVDFFMVDGVGDTDEPVTREQRLINVGLAIEALVVEPSA